MGLHHGLRLFGVEIPHVVIHGDRHLTQGGEHLPEHVAPRSAAFQGHQLRFAAPDDRISVDNIQHGLFVGHVGGLNGLHEVIPVLTAETDRVERPRNRRITALQIIPEGFRTPLGEAFVHRQRTLGRGVAHDDDTFDRQVLVVLHEVDHPADLFQFRGIAAELGVDGRLPDGEVEERLALFGTALHRLGFGTNIGQMRLDAVALDDDHLFQRHLAGQQAHVRNAGFSAAAVDPLKGQLRRGHPRFVRQRQPVIHPTVALVIGYDVIRSGFFIGAALLRAHQRQRAAVIPVTVAPHKRNGRQGKRTFAGDEHRRKVRAHPRGDVASFGRHGHIDVQRIAPLREFVHLHGDAALPHLSHAARNRAEQRRTSRQQDHAYFLHSRGIQII